MLALLFCFAACWPARTSCPEGRVPEGPSPQARGQLVVIAAQPISGHVFRYEGKRRPVWRAKYRLPDGRQVQRTIGPAWTARGRPPVGYWTKRRGLAPSATRGGSRRHGSSRWRTRTPSRSMRARGPLMKASRRGPAAAGSRTRESRSIGFRARHKEQSAPTRPRGSLRLGCGGPLAALAGSRAPG